MMITTEENQIKNKTEELEKEIQEFMELKNNSNVTTIEQDEVI